MGAITAGIGLISGLDTAALIDSLLTLESRNKFALQARIGTIRGQQSALLAVNSQLQALKSAASIFRRDNIFQSIIASTTDEEVLSASATTKAQPGAYTFIVKQLVSSSQFVGGGVATRNETPLGLSTLSFEFGQGRINRDASTDDLNGGTGIARGKIDITDTGGETATIDLTDVTTISEIVDRINSATDIDVTASVSGQGLVITDNSGTGGLVITDTSGYTTATDLGIADSVAANTGTVSTGASIFYLGTNTAIKTLNDGNGVLIRGNNPDFSITAKDGTVFDIDLGRVDNDIDDDTLLADLNDGEGVTIDSDSDVADIKFITREGTEYDVDLTGVTTVGGMRSRISSQTGGEIILSVHADGNKFTVTDTTGGTANNLKILGTDENGDTTAEDLGILNEDGVAAATYDGDEVPSTIDKAETVTLQDVIDRINDAAATDLTPNAGRIVASIRADGLGLRIQDTTLGGDPLVIAASGSNPDAAAQLGIETAGFAGDDFTSTARVIGGLDSVLVGSLNGGTGLGGATTIDVTDRDGANFNLNTVDTHETIGDLVDALNAEAEANGVDVVFSVNDAGNGLAVVDSSGGASNLIISGDAATALGVTTDDAVTSVLGTNVQRQYVSNSSRLDDMNYGQGIGTGSFRITDGDGDEALVTIGGDEKTIYDVIEEINSRGIDINARVNDNGDGILLEDTSGASVKMKIESVSGSTARDLNLLGETDDVGENFDGSYERTIEVSATDTLDTVVDAINDAGIPVSASVINTGSGATPFHISLSSGVAGARGDLVIDTGGVDLELGEVSDGQDAKVFFGSSDPATAFLIRSPDDKLNDVIEGVTIDLHKVSDDPVTVTLKRNDAAVLGSVNGLITSFNDTIDAIDGFDFFDVDSEQRGALFGNPTTSNARAGLFRTVIGKALNVDGQYQYLSQVGFGVDREGHLKLDQAKFSDAFEENPADVEALLATYDIDVGGQTEISGGITVATSGTTYNALGVANLLERFLDEQTDSIDGRFSQADDAFENQIRDMNGRIEFLDLRLEARRETLTRQFAAMELAIADLQSQSQSLAAIQGIR